jgi:hypothetical protein
MFKLILVICRWYMLSALLSHANMFEGETNWSFVPNLPNPFHTQFTFQTFLMSLILCELNGIMYLSVGKVFLHSRTSRSLCVPNRLNVMKLLRLGHYCNHQCFLPRRRLTSTATSIPKICIVGSGPASFYTAQHLIKVWGTRYLYCWGRGHIGKHELTSSREFVL